MSITAVVADDSDPELQQIIPILKRIGVTVLASFRDGLSAWKYIQSLETPPDLLVTDYVMPHMSGAELATHVKNARLATRVLMWSSAGQKGAAYGDPDSIHCVRIKPYLRRETESALRELGFK